MRFNPALLGLLALGLPTTAHSKRARAKRGRIEFSIFRVTGSQKIFRLH